MKTQTSIAAILLTFGMIVLGFSISYGLTHFKPSERHVTVKGLSERVVKADQAIWTINFSGTDNDLKQLHRQIKQSQQAIKNFLVQRGFNTTQLQILPIHITDNASNTYNTNQNAKRFQAHGQVVLFTNHVDQVIASAQETETLVDKGVIITDSQVEFNFTKFNEIKPTMLDEATLNAKISANTFAKNSNSQIKGIRRASQGTFSISSANGATSQISPLKKIRVVTTVEYYLG